ncbi:restriction endonuclease [Actinophytocola oryzae]|uniref:Restriction system protein n=1 Tax=Actinophytocola oryzae TaxID=502181 RepID=A0A4R7VNW4_9PSEU|nr:restriction endonuclease [Actinophytocola oryzae]TDV51048.1 restriction system protein [Actinophytocola oryzae]
MATSRGGRQEWERQQQAQAREAERRRREAERAKAAAEKERKQQYRDSRQAEVDNKNAQLEQRVAQLSAILVSGLHRTARIDILAQVPRPKAEPLRLGPLANPVPTPTWDRFAPRLPGTIARMLGGTTRYERTEAAARVQYDEAVQEAVRQEAERQRRVRALCSEHTDRINADEQKWRDRVASANAYVRAIADRDKAAIETYLKQVLTRVSLPADFPRKVDVIFNPRAEQAVVQIELPPHDTVPTVSSYKYLTTKDEERSAARPRTEVESLYRKVISQVALLCARDLFDSDPKLQSVGLNGHTHAINPATGEQEYPCLISMNVERDTFPKDDNLSKVTPEACVKHLKAIVSNHPYALEPIEPILDFDLSKYKFVEGFDAVATLDSRPDLMEMSPTNFEHLVRQIFEAQGAEGWTTQQSKDDGVDAVIVQRKALMGGLSIVQAKRYSGVVGVNHVRELAGAMEEKKAGWGILITTSWFASGCLQKAREHGRMELIDGEKLTYLIKEYLGKEVLIGIPNRPH